MRFSHIFIALTLYISGICSGSIKVSAAIESSAVYVGDSFIYQVIIDGSSQEGSVDTSVISRWQPEYAGGQNASSSMISIINGRQTKEETKKFVMNYKLKAFQVGNWTIPSLQIVVEGTKYYTNPIEFLVIEAGKTDKMEISAELSDKSCFVGQPVILNVKWYIMADVGEFNFDIPFFNNNDFIIDDTTSNIDPAGSRQNQFTINGVEVDFSQKQTVRYGAQAIEVSFKKAIIPQQVGTVNLGKVSVLADIAIGIKKRQRGNDPFGGFFDDDFFGRQKEYRKFSAESDNLVLEVKPLPSQDKPADFYGLVGNYEISATASAKEKTADGKIKAAVGEPITLTIKIGGNEYLNAIKNPNLFEIKELADNFVIPNEQSPPAVEDNYKVFVQTIRAKNNNVKFIPSIPLSYFDIKSGKYITRKTDPIPLEIIKTSILTDFSGVSPDEKTANEIKRIQEGLSANYQGDDLLKNYKVSAQDMLIRMPNSLIWQLPFVFMVSCAIFRIAAANKEQNTIRKIQKNAAKKAIKYLHTIKDNNCDEFADCLRAYIADKIQLPKSTLTSDLCREFILKETSDAQLAEQFYKILSNAEKGKYSPIPIIIDKETVEITTETIKKIEKKRNKK